ncbi:unnamed protein product [Ambrosiozyma monospora]|uniref:Unnamed protein product n=1 Tax=Ambrosiozyma monospora TaxID=43982 RepID=A0ACB5T100_AMBMO|nr:unnamed protein product [Ambrosiozyma monospora]
MSSSGEEDLELDGGMFEEPENFRPPPPEAHFASYTRLTPIKCQPEITDIKLRLVGKSPLWGHLLWNAGIYTAQFVEKHPELIKDKKIVEFGAASALPSLLCSMNGADSVVSTDYPDNDLLDNIKYNVDHLPYPHAKDNIKVEGFIWGNETDDIKKLLGSEHADFLIIH